MKNHTLRESFRHAFDGIRMIVKTERNMKIHLVMTILVVLCAVLFGLTAIEKAIVISLCALVICAEFINTAIENTVDIGTAVFNMYAKRAKDAGFAGVELHGAHLYLLSQCFYPEINHRTDGFGGTAKNRFRIIRDCFEAVKMTCGDDFPVFL